MPKFLLISSGMADAIQLYDDIVRIDNDSNSITPIESGFFNIQYITNITKEDINDRFNSLMVSGNYPKFPFSIESLSIQDRADLSDPGVNYSGTMAIINNIPIKDPV